MWYVIQKTGTSSSCVIYNITKTDEPGEYDIEQVSQRNPLSVGPLKHEYSYTGKLTVTDKDVPARMTVRFPLSKLFGAGFLECFRIDKWFLWVMAFGFRCGWFG